MSDGSTWAAGELGTSLRGDDPGEPIRSFAGLVDDKRMLELLNHYDSLFHEPVEETAIGRKLLEDVATETIDESVRAGNVSQMKAATGLTSQSESKQDFFVEIADRLTHEGAVGLVFGSPGSGKTSIVLDTAQVWRAVTGGHVIANIDWDGADGQFYSDDEMLEKMAAYEGPVLAVIDEVAQELSGFGTGSKKAEAFSDSLLFIRKRQEEHGQYAKRGSVMMVAHTRTKTAKEIRRVASFAVEKPNKSKKHIARILESEGGKDAWEELTTYQGITPTAESYDEHQASDFDVSEDYDDSNADGDDQQTNRVDPDVETALRLYYGEADLTGKEAADAVDKSDTWFYNKKEDFEDGELDLVLDIDETAVPQ